jgi:hypothetical protein
MYLTGGATAVLEGWRDGIEPDLFRFPAVDPATLRAAVESLPVKPEED